MLGLITQSAATSTLKVTPAKPAEVIAEQNTYLALEVNQIKQLSTHPARASIKLTKL